MLFFGYSPFPPHLQYHVADREGRLVRSEVIDVAWPSMMHDFAITKDHVIFILCPLVFSFENLAKRGSVFSWEPERGTRLGVMPRSGGNADVKWFETEASYVFHPMNAFADGDAIVLDVARYGRLDFMSPQAAANPSWRDENAARMHRWRIDLQAGGVKSTPLDDIVTEFPRVDERRLGRRYRFGYTAAREPELNDGAQPLWTAVKKYDFERGTAETRRFGAENGVGEPLFVPRGGRAARGRHGPRPRGRAPRLPLGVDGGGVRLGRGDPARLDRGADDEDPPRLGDHADVGAHAGHDGIDRDLARPALGRPLPLGARRVRPAGGRGVARAALRQAAHAHARVHRDHARDLGSRATARAPGRALPDPLSRPGLDRPREAAPLDPPRAPDPHLRRRHAAEERGAGGRDRRRLARGLVLALPHRLLPRRARVGLPARGRREVARQLRRGARRHRHPGRRRAGLPRLREADARALHRRHGRARQELLQRARLPLRLRGGREEGAGPLPRRQEGRGDGRGAERARRRGVAGGPAGPHPRPARGVARVGGVDAHLRHAAGGGDADVGGGGLERRQDAPRALRQLAHDRRRRLQLADQPRALPRVERHRGDVA